MPASMTTNQRPSGLRFEIDDLREEHAGRADDPAARLEHEREAGASRWRRAARGVVLDRDHGLAGLVGDAEAAAEIEVLERDAVGGERAREIGDDRRPPAPAAQAW